MLVENKRVLVVGLARSGLAVAGALARHGAKVTVSDRKAPNAFRDVLPLLMKEKVGVELGQQRRETFLQHDLIVISPGVPWDLPELEAARQAHIPIYPEVEAASWFLDGTLVGITGSNGKTTTTTLLGEMLKASGFPTFVGGNIGNALSSAVGAVPPGTRFVTELSSFQLEGIHELRPHVAVMLNLSPNHLDRHPSLEAYAEAKRQIFRNQSQQDYAVLNADDTWVASLQDSVSSRPILFSRQRELPAGVFAAEGKIYYRLHHLERELFEARDVHLRGAFNLEDVLAATAAACVLGADFAAIRHAIRSFKGVEHRLEFVREIRGVDFYNNSKATSVDAAVKSLEVFERGVHLILGGKDKGAPYTPLVPLLRDRVREVLLIGAAAPVITHQLAGAAELVQAGDLETAVYEAFARARPGDTVLLAPACSSFDQFTDYEERGRVFKDIVNAIRDPGLGRNRDSGMGRGELGVGSREPGRRQTKRESAVGRRDFVKPELREAAPAAVPETVRQEERKSETGSWESGKTAGDVGRPVRDASPEVSIEAILTSPKHVASSAAVPAGELANKGKVPNRIVDLEPAAPKLNVEAPTPEPDSPISTHDSPAVAPSQAPAAAPEPQVAQTEPAAPRELRYVYETDMEELPAPESQAAPEESPGTPTSAEAEVVDDEALPFEVRKRKSGGQNPKPGGKQERLL